MHDTTSLLKKIEKVTDMSQYGLEEAKSIGTQQAREELNRKINDRNSILRRNSKN